LSQASAIDGLALAIFNCGGGFLDVGFAFKAAVDEASQGVKEAEAVERAVFHGFLEALGAEVDDSLADLGDSDFWSGLVTGNALGAAGEVECEFVAEFAFFDALLVSEPVAIAAMSLPSGEVLGSEGGEK